MTTMTDTVAPYKKGGLRMERLENSSLSEWAAWVEKTLNRADASISEHVTNIRALESDSSIHYERLEAHDAKLKDIYNKFRMQACRLDNQWNRIKELEENNEKIKQEIHDYVETRLKCWVGENVVSVAYLKKEAEDFVSDVTLELTLSEKDFLKRALRHLITNDMPELNDDVTDEEATFNNIKIACNILGKIGG